MSITLAVFLPLVALALAFTVREVRANALVRVVPSAEEKASGNYSAILDRLARGETVAEEDWRVTDAMVATVRGRYDTADFAFQTALRVLLSPEYRAKVPPERVGELRGAFTGFRFWLTQPGQDGMCLWSENHQLIGAVNEYFTALLWPEDVFANDGRPAAEHKADAASRIASWLSLRWRYGFSEWLSPTYYVEDVSPLCLVIDFAEDEKLKTRAAIVLDLLLYDLAANHFRGILNGSSGRCYERAKKGADIGSFDGATPLRIYDSLRYVMEELVGGRAGAPIYEGLGCGGVPTRVGRGNPLTYNFVYRKHYAIPAVIRAIANDGAGVAVMKASQGLNAGELRGEGLLGQGDEAIMMQWGMEAFSNPEVIANSMRFIGRHGLISNEMLHPFKAVNLGILKASGLLPLVSALARPFTNGKAIERANTYTYRTGRYLLQTAQLYHPAYPGDQQHLWAASFGAFGVFTTNPSSASPSAPGFWVGNGYNPSVAQEGRVVLAIYEAPARRGLMQEEVIRSSHAYFPASLFDSTDESGLADGLVFGEKGGAFIALLASSPLSFVGGDGAEDSGPLRHNLVQDGGLTAWICEMSDRDRESFDEFRRRVAASPRRLEGRVLSYESSGSVFSLSAGGPFSVDGKRLDLEYGRYEGPYIKAPRKASAMEFSFGGKGLSLDFEKCLRKEVDA